MVYLINSVCYMFTVVTETEETYCITHNYSLGSCTDDDQIRLICKVDEPQGYQLTMEMNIFRSGKSKIFNVTVIFHCCFYHFFVKQ